MEQKLNEENMENNLVFCIDPRKAFGIKSISRSAFRNPLRKNKIRLFRLNLDFGFYIKTMTKQTVYLNSLGRKSRFR